jgi:hypothetical protein
MGTKRNSFICGGGEVYGVLVWKPEGRRLLGKPRRKWDDNVKINLGDVKWGDTNWTYLAQDWDSWRALVNAGMNLRVS